MKPLFTILLLYILASCQEHAAPLKVEAAEPTGFIHTVYFWVKIDADQALVDDFQNGLDTLGTIPSIQSYIYGPPAMTPREVVNNSYKWAWIVHFKDKADHEIYQEHPKHLHFIERYQSIWDSVQVYDNLVTKISK